jgi:hypothetical protein
LETYCKIRELRDGLEIRVDRKVSSWTAIGVAAIAFLLLGFGAMSYFHMLVLVVPVSLIFVIILMVGVAKQGARLQVTRIELSGLLPQRGKSGGGEFRLNTADVGWLEYRQMDAFGIRGFGGSGLYAVKSIGAKCVLPFVDSREATIIMQAIGSKFPGLTEMWRGNLQVGAATHRTENKP